MTIINKPDKSANIDTKRPGFLHRLYGSLAFKVGAAVIITELMVLIAIGIPLIDRHNENVDQRAIERILLPGTLLQEHVLKYASIADHDIMTNLLGEELISGMIVGRNANVFHSLVPDHLGKDVSSIPGINATWFESANTQRQMIRTKSGEETFLVSITPLFTLDSKTPSFFAYIKTNTTKLTKDKADWQRAIYIDMFAIVLATSVIIFISFQLLIFRRIRRSVDFVNQVRRGNLSTQIDNPGRDELGTLERGMNEMIEDISNRQEQRSMDEESLRMALVDAEQANQAKSDFLATMSHELRTPLNAIIGFSDMIEGQYFGALGSDKYSEYAHDIHESSIHLLSLINDILDLSAIEAGKQPLIKENLIPKDVAEDCAPIIANAATEKNIEFSMEVADNLPTLYADKRAVRQILFNLLSNAIKYTPSGGKVLLNVSVNNGFHVHEISDTGRGVPPEKIATLTDPFVRSNDDPHKSQEGTGLGLAIVQSLVNLHKGNLHIESEVGVGTTVTVKLPSAAP